MPLIAYESHEKYRPSRKTRAIIEQANAILENYVQQGFTLTVRQTYYQFVARGIIPNHLQSYKRLSDALNNGRLAGLIDWDYIEDRTRNLRGNQHWETPGEILRGAANGYQLDKWEGQKYRVEVWIEKDALTGIIEGVCSRLDVDYFACRGYTSQSEMWRAAQRHIAYQQAGQEVVLLHLGDHDPSGTDMSRDIEERLRMFGSDTDGFHRIALNMDQIKAHNPPPNPAKVRDSRYHGYTSLHGISSWELDALEPKIIVGLIEAEVKKFMDEAKWNAAKERQENERKNLTLIADRWEEVEQFLTNGKASVRRAPNARNRRTGKGKPGRNSRGKK